MKLRDIAIYADESLVEEYPGGFVQRFHRETCCVAELYLALLKGKAETGNVAKVVLKFRAAGQELAEPQLLIDVLEIERPFDFEHYQTADPATRKKLIAQSLQAALLSLCEKHDWDADPFQETFAEAERQKFDFEGFSKTSWLSPSQRFRARLFFRFELDSVELDLVIFRNRSREELLRKPLGKAVPEMGCLGQLLKEGRWKSETSFEARSTDFQQQVWKVELSELAKS